MLRRVHVQDGATFLGLVRVSSQPGAADTEALGLVEVCQRTRAGALDLRSADGQWAMGLALVAAG